MTGAHRSAQLAVAPANDAHLSRVEKHLPRQPLTTCTWCAVACTFPAHIYVENPDALLLTFVLFDISVFAWVGAVLWSWSFLTSRARRVCEEAEAERSGRHPPRPAAVAAVFLVRTVPARAGGSLHGRRAVGNWWARPVFRALVGDVVVGGWGAGWGHSGCDGGGFEAFDDQPDAE